MKRPLSFFLCMAMLACCCCACSDKNSPTDIAASSDGAFPSPLPTPQATLSPSPVPSPAPSPVPVLPTIAPEPEFESSITETSSNPQGPDVDLTTLSSTMVYAEVFNMMMNPDEYVGKQIRIQGQFTAHQDDATGRVSCGVIVKDATACCAQGFDLLMPDNAVYPDDYPALDEEITVTGTLQVDRSLENVGIVFLQLAQITLE